MAGNTYLARDPTTQLPKEIAATQTSAGATNANQIVALDGTGFLNSTLFPAGIGEASVIIPATEALAAGAMVNVWGGSGGSTPSARNANSTDATKPAQGFVLSAFASAANATVYFPGQIVTGLSGLTIGASVFLSTTAGVSTPTAPSASGNLIQQVGTALSTTSMVFNPDPGIIHA